MHPTAHRVCGGQRTATESGGRRWLGDFPMTLYLKTPHSQGCLPGNIHFGPLFIHHIPLLPLQQLESAQMTLTGKMLDGFGAHSSTKIPHFGSDSE